MRSLGTLASKPLEGKWHQQTNANKLKYNLCQIKSLFR